MKLSKSTVYILLYVLGGATTAAEISQEMPERDIRSIQRAFERLTELRLVKRGGPNNRPSYAIDYTSIFAAHIPDKVFEDESRPGSSFSHDLVDWLQKVPIDKLEEVIGRPHLAAGTGQKISAKDLEYLTVELSWKSSALEGNTYTLLDTQLLLVEGVKAKGKTEFETQMILNHKDAIAFIVKNPELFSRKITFATVEELHRIIGYNLGIPKGIRRKLVRISASNYVPLANPHQLRENAGRILEIIGRPTNPFTKSLLALSLIPYLQIFEDGNKRTGRMLANAILISTMGKGFSLRKVSARELALAYLAFYEFNSARSLSDILHSELS